MLVSVVSSVALSLLGFTPLLSSAVVVPNPILWYFKPVKL